MTVEFSNLREAKGSLYIAVYDRQGAFLQAENARAKKILPLQQSGTLRVSLGPLPPGEYALSCFHDLNDNGKLDTNLLGIPSEPYGFSNNARPKFRAPRWSEAVFFFSGGSEAVKIRLEKW